MKKNCFFYSAIMVSLLSGYAKDVLAREHFNPAALETNETGITAVDLSAFEKGDQEPGKYQVDSFVNNEKVGNQNIMFSSQKDLQGRERLQPCLSPDDLKAWGVMTNNFSELRQPDSQCANLSAIAGAEAIFQFQEQRLDIHIPQVALVPHVRGYISPDQWDEGINALILNYNISGVTSHSQKEQEDTQSQYANLRPGINIGAWRFRNYSTWLHDSTSQSKWDSAYTYISRDLRALNGQFLLGENTSPSDVFDSIAFRGIQISSDDDMLPDSQKGFAPTIRGIARTSAEVTVEQNGYVIYKTNVPAGAFEISDLYPTGGAGDLYVYIKESDGITQRLVIPYANVTVLQREGHLKYDFTGGKTRNHNGSGIQEDFIEATALYGLPHGVTLYGGIQASTSESSYQAMQAGTGFNLGEWGATSLDVTNALAHINCTVPSQTQNECSRKEAGQSWRIRYNKEIPSTGTDFSFAGYRYSTRGYYSFQDSLNTYSDNSYLTSKAKSRTDITVAQDISYGAVTLSFFEQSYWNKRKSTSTSIGYNNNWDAINYSLNYTQTQNTSDRTTDRRNNWQLAFNISIPLDEFLPSTYASYSMNSASHADTTHTVGLNGSALQGNNLSWNVQQGYSAKEKAVSGSLNANYSGSFAALNAGYSYDSNMKRINYGIQGGALLHRDGLTLSQPLNETIILVKAPDAADIPINNETGIHTDVRGYAVVPYASPYHRNEVNLKTDDINNNNLELIDTSKKVVPTRGAVVRAEYETSVGFRALITLTRKDNHPVPFGAIAKYLSVKRDREGIVGDSGLLYLSGLGESGKIVVRWGKKKAEQCQVNYHLPENKSAAGVELLHALCS